ncbi:MAG: ABC transporter [Clostridiales bacterium 43-6]|nr:MAG: ABC transporter [Clostridiales bacterium 43-6]
MNIFVHEIKSNLKALIFWCVGMALMATVGMSKYAGAEGNMESFKEIINKIPKALLAFFGMTGLDITTAVGYFGVVFTFLLVMAGIHAVMLGANIIAKEERDKTSEFLLAKPVSRSAIITYKLLAIVVNIIIVNLITTISSVGIVSSYAESNQYNSQVLLLMVGLLIFQLIFLFLGTAVSAVKHRPKTSASTAAMILFSTYILSVLVDVSGEIDFLSYLTPFKYTSAKYILENQRLDPFCMMLSFIIIVASIIVTYCFYKRRDMVV